MRPAYIGIDVAIAKGKRLPVVVCTWQDRRLIPERLRNLDMQPPRGSGNAAILHPEVARHFAREAMAYVKTVCSRLDLEPIRAGIDAPSAPCEPGCRRRAAELALDGVGISCFATPTAEGFEEIRATVTRHLADGGREDRIPHANQLWMLAGFAIFDELSREMPCLEVFPQATVRAIGSGATHKSESGAVSEQLAAAARHTGWPTGFVDEPRLEETGWGAPHDLLDAYLAAWVAALDEPRRFSYGNPPNDAIWTPSVGVPQWPDAPRSASYKSSRFVPRPDSSAEHHPISTDQVVLCPACGVHQFKRWPWGWDAHAAHTCTALAATDPAERKLEYRRRYSEYF